MFNKNNLNILVSNVKNTIDYCDLYRDLNKK
jgi:hypothetical protein